MRTTSVVIPVKNGEALLAQVLDAVKAQAPDEILVIDSGSTDRSLEIARAAGVEVLESLRRVVGSDFAIEERPKPPTFVDTVVLNTSRFRTEFGEVPMTPMDEGIRRTYDEIRSGIER